MTGASRVSGRAGDPRHFRSVLGHYPTGIVAVTALVDGRPVGMIAGTFASVSLDPPLVSFMPSRDSASFQELLGSSRFCVNILGDHQEHICRAFAVKGATDKFAGVRWQPAPSGSPILENVVAWIDCDRESVLEAGDHYIVLGRVRELATGENAPELPLLFFQGGYGKFSPSSRTVPAAPDLLDQLRLVDSARPRMEALARELGMECAAVGAVEDTVIRLASAGSPPDGRSPARVGLRLPFAAPMAPLLVAWADPREQEDWFDRGLAPDNEDERARHRAALARLRTRGWTVSLYNDAFHRLDEALVKGESPTPPEFRDSLRRLGAELAGPLTYEHELRPGEEYQVRNVSAPVFDARGQVALYLSLSGFPVSATGSRVVEVVERLVETASRVTDSLVWAGREERGNRR
ncbi:flavin reductase [Amycolatopsis rhabdoformis]|uniref:Flavin reductase n=1 Tax=Amycolatopsis rhabdoformis TaxID=1448059 RepID=A0ABZ1IKP7_9PSEU|nr:flavin reductase [Amycolatopsis rhabdoformis]WSE34328.1 flavin reductase [Amycolatopsis rhabdoformis]